MSANWQEAIAYYSNLVASDPSNCNYIWHLGLYYWLDNQQELAEATWLEILVQQPEKERDLLLFLHQQAIAFQEQCQIIPAWQIRQCIDQNINPEYPLARENFLLWVILDRQQHLLHDPRVADYDLVQAHIELANIYLERGDRYSAIPLYRWLVRQFPNSYDYGETLANLLNQTGSVTESLFYYHTLLLQQAGSPHVLKKSLLSLPIIYETQEEITYWRDRFTTGLRKFQEIVADKLTSDPVWAWQSIQGDTNFYLAYQGLDDRPLQEIYGNLVCQIMARNLPQYAEPLTMPAVDDKIRVGYISNHLRFHAATRSCLNWLKYSDRQQFEIYSYLVDRRTDFFTEEFKQASDFFRHIPLSIPEICQQVRADNLHILVHTDIGMHPFSSQLAGLRLAPIQCNSWGHPITSGMPTIDYYLSSDLMEISSAQKFYTETLVRLPNLGFSYPRVTMPEVTKTRADFGLPEHKILFLSCQTLCKYLPQYDYLFPRIAMAVPQSCFVFLANPSPVVTQILQRRLARVFASYDLSWQQYCIFLPQMLWYDYLNLQRVCDIFLDTLAWSGGNSSLEAIACGLPIVTCPSEQMRSRHTYAMLKILGVTATIADSPEQYIDIAIKLAEDREWRAHVVVQMQERRELLYDDRQCVSALEQFYQQAVARRS
jgi:predicted O-linked N-acetylglucosamine transferase (SPINDLY family)